MKGVGEDLKEASNTLVEPLCDVEMEAYGGLHAHHCLQSIFSLLLRASFGGILPLASSTCLALAFILRHAEAVDRDSMIDCLSRVEDLWRGSFGKALASSA